MIEEQCEYIIALCETYVEGDRLEDVGNIRALYEEYGDGWIPSMVCHNHHKSTLQCGLLTS